MYCTRNLNWIKRTDMWLASTNSCVLFIEKVVLSHATQLDLSLIDAFSIWSFKAAIQRSIRWEPSEALYKNWSSELYWNPEYPPTGAWAESPQCGGWDGPFKWSARASVENIESKVPRTSNDNWKNTSKWSYIMTSAESWIPEIPHKIMEKLQNSELEIQEDENKLATISTESNWLRNRPTFQNRSENQWIISSELWNGVCTNCHKRRTAQANTKRWASKFRHTVVVPNKL